ncbi:MAG: hypothetical protein ACI4KG_01245 [Oscillospiraceae bacterium]
MLESGKAFVKTIPANSSGSVPDEIKIHTQKTAKVVPDENKTHSGDASRCRIIPGERIPDIDSELKYEGLSLNSGEQIKIVP